MLSFLLSPLLFSCVTCLHILLIITTKAKGKKMSEYILDFFNVDKSLIILGGFRGSPFFTEIAEQKTVSVTTFHGA